MKTYITVKNQFEGIHRYKDAPEEVYFLRDYHRHIFTIKTKIEVFGEDRELEFILVKRLIDNFLTIKKEGKTFWLLDNMSCEQIGLMLWNFLKQKYGKERKITIEVSEDDENSAIIEED